MSQYPARQKPSTERDEYSLHDLQLERMIADRVPVEYVARVTRLYDAHDALYEQWSDVHQRLEDAIEVVESATEEREPITLEMKNNVIQECSALQGILKQLELAYRNEVQ
jgi:hypothetical protein